MDGSESADPQDKLRSSAMRLVDTLDPIEVQVLAFLVQGWSRKNIASCTGLTSEKVEDSFESMMGKLQADRIADVVRIGIYARIDRPG